MPKIRKKISPKHYYKFKEQIESEWDSIFAEYDKIAKINGWKDGRARTYAMMKNYIAYEKHETLEWEGD